MMPTPRNSRNDASSSVLCIQTAFSGQILPEKTSGTSPNPVKPYSFHFEHASDTSANGIRFVQFQDTLYNTPVQGTAADITKKALGLLPQRLEDTGAQIIGTVHAEIIL